MHRLAQKGQHGIERFIGLVNQHIALAQPFEKRLPRHQLLRPARLVTLKAHGRGTHQVNELVHAHQVDRAVGSVQSLHWQPELLEQKIRQECRATRRHLQAHGLTVMALLQPLPQGGPEVFDLLLVHRQVGMAGDPELRKLGHLSTREQIGQMRADQAGNGHKQLLLRPACRRNAEKPGQMTRHFNDGHLVLTSEGITALQSDNEIERLVGHLWKRVCRVEPHRHQQGLNLAHETVAHPATLAGIALAVRQYLDATLLQRGQQGGFVNVVLLINQGVNALCQGQKSGIGVSTFFVA